MGTWSYEPRPLFSLFLECSKKVKDHLEKAIAAFNKEIRHNQHKVHLLCLVARGLYLSRQCDDIVRQGLLLSVLGELFVEYDVKYFS